MKKSIEVRFLSLGMALLAIAAFFTLHPRGRLFLSPQNLSNLSIELAVTAVLALGMLLVLLPGMIDLSVGSGVGMLGGLAAVLIVKPDFIWPGMPDWPPALALLATLLLAMAIWALMGALISRLRIPAFIITLGGLLIFKGLHWAIIHNATIPVAVGGQENINTLLTTYYLPEWASYVLGGLVALGIGISRMRARRLRRAHGLPVDEAQTAFIGVFIGLQALLLLIVVLNLYKGVPLALVVLGAVAWATQVITQHTSFGRYLYAIGSNEDAAVLSGINVNAVVICAYVALGAIVAVAGFMQTAYGGYSTTTVGNLMELDAIAACVIGGTSLKGGRGTVLGVLCGALIMATLLNGMTLLAVTPELKTIARGTVLVLAVWMDVWLSRRYGAGAGMRPGSDQIKALHERPAAGAAGVGPN